MIIIIYINNINNSSCSSYNIYNYVLIILKMRGKKRKTIILYHRLWFDKFNLTNHKHKHLCEFVSVTYRYYSTA